uniref:Uncharacterized protein n=1 Tax=Anguilla anguilla TaxID=7936 RepID=A0A0E9Q9L5_ANGAN
MGSRILASFTFPGTLINSIVKTILQSLFQFRDRFPHNLKETCGLTVMLGKSSGPTEAQRDSQLWRNWM